MKVLDHGYVELVETWGSDASIIEAARMSTGKGFKGWGPGPCKRCGVRPENNPDGLCDYAPGCGPETPCDPRPGDEKLLRYLYEHKHSTPFEMAGAIFQIKAPIFVFRQWHRHRTQSYNELSGRYTPVPDEHYVPTVERLLMSGGKNKQAQGHGTTLTYESLAGSFRDELQTLYSEQQEFYTQALADGVPKELARLAMPVGRYSAMRASANLRNWLAFLTLRMDSHAQWEIQEYARAVGTYLADAFPRTWGLFCEGMEAAA